MMFAFYHHIVLYFHMIFSVYSFNLKLCILRLSYNVINPVTRTVFQNSSWPYSIMSELVRIESLKHVCGLVNIFGSKNKIYKFCIPYIVHRIYYLNINLPFFIKNKKIRINNQSDISLEIFIYIWTYSTIFLCLF